MENNSYKIAVSDILGVLYTELEKLGVFNSSLYIDEKFFVDPSLLPKSNASEFQNGLDTITDYYRDIIQSIGKKILYKNNKNLVSKLSKEILHKLSFREIHSISLGYGTNSKEGAGVGGVKATAIETALTEFIIENIKDPELFFLIPILTDVPIGADNISDMVIHILIDQIYKYTENILTKLNIPKRQPFSPNKSTNKYNLVPHPSIKGEPILLLPYDILSELPVMDTYNKYINNDTNDDLRRFIDNEILKKVGEKPKKRDYKVAIKQALLKNTDQVKYFVNLVKSVKPENIDITETHSMDNAIRLLLGNNTNISIENSLSVKEIISILLNSTSNALKNNINMIRKLLHNLSENSFHDLITIYIHESCRMFNIDINKESLSGGGRIDLKFSRGTDKVVVEVKLSTHSNLLQHYNNQLVAYQNAENAYGFYVVIDVNKGSKKTLDEFKQSVQSLGYTDRECIFIDAQEKVVPSKRKDEQDKLF